MTRLSWFYLLTILAGGSSSAWAAPIFEGQASPTFTSATPTAYTSITTTGNSTILQTGLPVSGSFPGQLTLTGNSFQVEPGQPFAVGSFEYTNGTTNSSNPGATSVLADLALTFNGALSSSTVFSFGFEWEHTPNSTGNAYQDADFLTPVSLFSSTNFSVANQLYTLQLLGFSQDGGANLTNSFRLKEEGTVGSQLFAQFIVPNPPQDEPTHTAEPASLAVWGLLVATVLGFGIGSHRRRMRTCLPIT